MSLTIGNEFFKRFPEWRSLFAITSERFTMIPIADCAEYFNR